MHRNKKDPMTVRTSPDIAESIPLADHDDIGRKVVGQPWAIQAAIVTICAHCTVLTDKHPTGDVADLAGCISQCCLELANALNGGVAQTPESKMTDDQIKHMVDRFLSWKLPNNFNPDAGISFKASFNEHTAHPSKREPSGTNLFDATQADAMVRYMIDGMPPNQSPQDRAP